MAVKVLLADPNPTTQKVVELILEKEEVKLTSAQSGEEALEKAENDPPDIMLLSEKLNDMDLFQFHHMLRERPLLRGTPCVALLTGRGLTAEQLLEEGISLYLEKPFEAKDLLEKIDKALFPEVGKEREETPEAMKLAIPQEEKGITEQLELEETTEDHVEPAQIDAYPEGQEGARVASGASDEEEDFTVYLKALSEEILQQSKEAGQGETLAEDELTASEEMAAQSETLEVDESLRVELGEVRPEGAQARPARPVYQPSGLSQAFGQYFLEAARRIIDEIMERVLRESVEKALEDMRPGLTELAKQKVGEFLPLMAELVIREEIEKLKEGLRKDNGDSENPPQ